MFSTAVGNLNARLQIPPGVHQAPFVFPFFPRRIELHLPWLIKSLKPEVLSPVIQRRTYPVVHELVHIVDTRNGTSLRIWARHIAAGFIRAVVSPTRRPADLRDDLLLTWKIVCLGDVLSLPIGVCPTGCLVDRYSAEELAS